MPITQFIGRAVRRIALGDTLLPQEFTLGMTEPQTEIAVRLCGRTIDRDVTDYISTACAEPLVICIGFPKDAFHHGSKQTDLRLLFTALEDSKRVLGEIELEYERALSMSNLEFLFFKPASSKNSCLSKTRLGMHYLLHAYRQWKRDNTQGIRMSFLERRASMVTFIRPHPILLVSVGDQVEGNIFPMNLCGGLGGGYFGFALRTERIAGTLVERRRRAALSSIPEDQGYLAYRMADNHTKESVSWNELPFGTRLSKSFRIPIPEFAQRVKEVEVETSIAIGSHRFFIARIVTEEKFSDGLGFCSVHGFYQYWRLKHSENLERELALALKADASHKRERHPAKP